MVESLLALRSATSKERFVFDPSQFQSLNNEEEQRFCPKSENYIILKIKSNKVKKDIIKIKTNLYVQDEFSKSITVEKQPSIPMINRGRK